MIPINRRNKKPSKYDAGSAPGVTLHKSGSVHLFRFNSAFFHEAKLNGPANVQFYIHEGRMIFGFERDGEYVLRPTSINFIYGFSAAALMRKAETTFGPIKKREPKRFAVEKTEIGGRVYWEIKPLENDQ